MYVNTIRGGHGNWTKRDWHPDYHDDRGLEVKNRE